MLVVGLALWGGPGAVPGGAGDVFALHSLSVSPQGRGGGHTNVVPDSLYLEKEGHGVWGGCTPEDGFGAHSGSFFFFL